MFDVWLPLQLRLKISELTDQMNRRKDELGESLQGAKRVFEVHNVFVKTVEVESWIVWTILKPYTVGSHENGISFCFPS